MDRQHYRPLDGQFTTKAQMLEVANLDEMMLFRDLVSEIEEATRTEMLSDGTLAGGMDDVIRESRIR